MSFSLATKCRHKYSVINGLALILIQRYVTMQGVLGGDYWHQALWTYFSGA